MFNSEEEHQQASETWDAVMQAVKDTIITTLKERVPNPTKAQLDFWHDRMTEQLYHAGWKAIEAIEQTS